MALFPSVVTLPSRALRLLELFLDSSERIFPQLSDDAKVKFLVCAFTFKTLCFLERQLVSILCGCRLGPLGMVFL